VALPKLAAASSAQMTSINEHLYGVERHMLLEGGLPRRPWFKHAVYAPGTLTGYDVKTLPGIREAVEAGQLDEARAQAGLVVEVLKSVDREIAETTRLLNGL
jgi:N-acetylated-alpha-linked acidic dipeptidase